MNSKAGSKQQHPPASEGGPDISKMIEKSGCSVPYYKLEDCLGESDRDFRKCQEQLKELKSCYNKVIKDIE